MCHVVLRLVRLTALVEEPPVRIDDRLIKAILGGVGHIRITEHLSNRLICE